jgi:hypothetical protein
LKNHSPLSRNLSPSPKNHSPSGCQDSLAPADNSIPPPNDFPVRRNVHLPNEPCPPQPPHRKPGEQQAISSAVRPRNFGARLSAFQTGSSPARILRRPLQQLGA